MSQPVFISYARNASRADAQALANRLEGLAFFDADVVDDGDPFPQRLLDGVLDARVVVIFATKPYTERRFCRLEMRLALAGCDAAANQIVLALGDGSNAVLDAMPAAVAGQSWPAATEVERLEALARSYPEACLARRMVWRFASSYSPCSHYEVRVFPWARESRRFASSLQSEAHQS